MTYYAVATDKNGFKFQTSQSSIKVVDCTWPSESNLTDWANGNSIGCSGAATITVSASDPDAFIQGVLLTWWGPAYTNQPPAGQVSMTYSIVHHAWQGTLNGAGWGAQTFAVLYDTTATDDHGNSSASHFSSTTASSDPQLPRIRVHLLSTRDAPPADADLRNAARLNGGRRWSTPVARMDRQPS